MALAASSSSSLAAKQLAGLTTGSSCYSKSNASLVKLGGILPRTKRSLKVSAAVDANSMPLTGVVFQPFEEVKKEVLDVPVSPLLSLARQKYEDECEAAINEQINVEYNVSYVYHALYAYFDRDNIALRGLAKFFKESSEEEREHAEKFMEYQNLRGGKVKLHSIMQPPSEFDHAEKGDALYGKFSGLTAALNHLIYSISRLKSYNVILLVMVRSNVNPDFDVLWLVDSAMELALSLEKLTNEKLLSLRSVADRNNDPQMGDFVESEFLGEQVSFDFDSSSVEAINKIAKYVSQLRMVGKGHGVWHFDQMLLHEGDAA
ncbi:hypothetical protein CUMW_000630 [Citrus unshiu]|nr:hypothetical protein CUMW_000630 [Citrus unshiu]